MSFKIETTKKGFRLVQDEIEKREGKLRDLRWVAEEFRTYTLENRIPSMMRNQGRVPGPYGRGYTRWASNSPWVRRVKADQRVFYKHGRRKSSIAEAFVFRMARGSGSDGGRVTITVSNTHPAVKHLQKGHSGFRVPKSGRTLLRIPFGFGMFLYRMKANVGPMPKRQIEGLREGDQKKVLAIADKGLVEV